MSESKSRQSLSSKYSSTNTKSKKNLGTLPVKGIVITVVVICIIVVAVIIMTVQRRNDGTSKSYNMVITPDNIEELQQSNKETVAAGSYDVSMNSTWTFANARSVSSNAYIKNPLSNSNTVNFTVTRNDTGAVIYTSPYIPVGSSLANIKLEDEEMSSGTYPCVVTYHLLDDNYESISTVKINISVVIEGD